MLPFNSSLSLLVPSQKLSTLSHHLIPPLPPHPTHEHALLSLLLKHQTKRHPSIQVHSQLITTALHRYHINETGMRIWNNLIRSYSLGCYPQEAIHIYQQMQDICYSPLPTDTFTFAFLLKACANLSHANAGIQFHGLTIKKGFEFNVYTHTSLLNMYATCGCLVDARRAFDEMPERNSVAWNAMITGYVNWGELSLARLLFEQMPDRNVISWTGLIDGYVRAYRPEEAFACFGQMMAEDMNPTEITVLAIVPAVSNFGALDMGESLHGYCEKNGICALDIRVQNSLIDMYAKCGSIESSYKVFLGMHNRRNLVSWTSIISGFAMHGMANEAVRQFEEMERADVKPNRVTFLSILNACSHGGLVEEGIRFFTGMVYEHGIEAEIKHYGCMIDMLGRAGRLAEAEEMIVGMPMQVNVIVWRTLLGCCSKHGDVEMGERVMRRIWELEKGYGGDYVVLSNMLSEVGRFDDAEMQIEVSKLLEMEEEGLNGGKVMMAVVSSCTHLGEWELAKSMVRSVESAQRLFGKMKERNIVPLDATTFLESMITAYSQANRFSEALVLSLRMQKVKVKSDEIVVTNVLGLPTNGYVESALEVFSGMLKEGFQHNDVAFLGVLIACAHSMADKRARYFGSMKEFNAAMEP
ncbi:putative Pentatricopeptide repeat-containing protein, mitochondrial [Cocos nucifera]|uniref:Putative Pentatricopeptide repeat-containing protein, mitochondrial n=1 Tax=Cocos nucifera TaxID=13894 RepID=A0A8K0I5A4_COCNU|nr:putative Pentatricopeptide repeat-containing protein, mitochondrial [Cocos nucifera]